MKPPTSMAELPLSKAPLAPYRWLPTVPNALPVSTKGLVKENKCNPQWDQISINILF